MSDPHAPAVDAASWAVAAHLAARLDDTFRLIEGHPGQTDLLWFVNSDQPGIAHDDVMLAVHGTGFIRVRRGDGTEVDGIGGSNVWQALAGGAVGVRTIVDQIVDALGATTASPPSAPRMSDRVYATIAATLARAALFGLRWTCLWGVLDSSTSWTGTGPRTELFLPYLADLVDIEMRDGEVDGPAGKYWFLLGEAGEPVAVFDVDGYIHLPAGGGSFDLTSADGALPAQVADTGFSSLIRRALRAKAKGGVPARSDLGLPAVLSAFNRKERHFLLGYVSGALEDVELHAPSLHLSPTFLRQLSAVVGLQVPAHAWAGTDYHLSWLHAAIDWHHGLTGPGQTSDFPKLGGPLGEVLVNGTQEDADVLVAWADEDGPHIVLVEAKAYGPWGNNQVDSKLKRIGAIKDAAGPTVDIRFVLTSPRPPEKLHVAQWPSWALTGAGKPCWMPLPAPLLRLKTERCDTAGRASANAGHWKIAGP
jgi:hypothetical protein